MSNYQVDICHIHTEQLTCLSSKDTINLLMIYRETKNPKIKDQIVMGNLKLVLSIVSKYRQHDLDDLFQAGCIGLMKVIEQFDLSQNVMFSTYAVPVIVGEIKACIRNKSLLHISRYIRDLSLKVSKVKESYLKDNKREILKEELLNCLNITEYELYQVENLSNSLFSLSEAKNGEDNLKLIDVIEDKKSNIGLVNNRICLEKALGSLNEKERWLITERYYNDKTQSEIAQELSLSQAQISRYEKKILKHLKNFFI